MLINYDGHNLGQNICRLFRILAKVHFTTSETELDYSRQNVNVCFASEIAERFKA